MKPLDSFAVLTGTESYSLPLPVLELETKVKLIYAVTTISGHKYCAMRRLGLEFWHAKK